MSTVVSRSGFSYYNLTPPPSKVPSILHPGPRLVAVGLNPGNLHQYPIKLFGFERFDYFVDIIY